MAKQVLVANVGVNDLENEGYIQGKATPAYRAWANILTYSHSNQSYINPCYKGCSVDPRWHKFSAFKAYFDEFYIEGFFLCKNIFSKKNKVYSPEQCCFLPPDLARLISIKSNSRVELPLGVKFVRSTGKYKIRFKCRGTVIEKGGFKTVEEAFKYYKQIKEKAIQDLATEYYNKDLISLKIFKALLNYKIEIDD